MIVIRSTLFLFLAFSTFIGHSQSQILEAPKEEYPFYDIIEWKGKGALLLNKEPSGKIRQVNLTLVSDQPNTTWNESFIPKGSESYYISSENARYIYFIDNLALDGGKYSFSQISPAGSVKTSISALASHFKKLGSFEYMDVELIDIVTTDKSLIHIFRYHDKAAKKYLDIAVFMTHHNLLLYSIIVGETHEDVLKDDYSGHWKFVGSTGEQIYFASREKQVKQNGWAIKEFNSKGILTQSFFLGDADFNFETIRNDVFSNSGSFYLPLREEQESAVLTHLNGHFYLAGIVDEGGKRYLKSYKQTDGKWVPFSSFLLTSAKGKKSSALAVCPLNEGLVIKISDGGIAQLVLLPFDKNKEILQLPFDKKIAFNPSRMTIQQNKNKFAVNLSDRNIFFDEKQLNNTGSVKFEIELK